MAPTKDLCLAAFDDSWTLALWSARLPAQFPDLQQGYLFSLLTHCESSENGE